MRARVTAILVARNGADYLPATLEALGQQYRHPDSVVFVDADSADASAALLAAAGPTQFVSAGSRSTFGSGVAKGLSILEPTTADNEWLWLLAHDNAPAPGALAALLNAVEIAPSVAVAGPKLMQWQQPDVIESFGESMTRYGRSIQLVTGELDQAQHDRREDLLAVASGGMLVRRRVFAELGGFDPGLPSIDAALDFCVRVRLAGHRVVTVPDAKVTTTGAPELFGRVAASRSTHARIARAAQLRRRLVYAPPVALPLHWLSLLPLAIMRSIVQIAAKRAWAVPGEIATAVRAAFDSSVVGARRNLARGRSLGWRAIAPLRVQPAQARELAANRSAASSSSAPVAGRLSEPETPRPGFFTAGGAWVVIVLAAIGVVANLRLLGESALTGGGLVPLSNTVAELWAHVGYGWHEAGAGFAGASDPFALVLAVLGTLTFWSPSTSIVVLYVLALPLAGLAAWACAARFSTRGWAPAVAAILWALAPPYLASLAGGQLGAVVAHLLLPWLLLAAVNAARSWSALGAAAILFAAVTASAPILAPALLLAWLAWMVVHPRAIYRLVGLPIPAAVLFLPLVLERAASGNWLALLADPGVPVLTTPASGWQLALGSAVPGLNGWSTFGASIGLPGAAAIIVVAVLLAPLAALALLALFLPGSRRSIPAMSLALLGFATAVLGAHIAVSHVGNTAAVIWTGSGLSLYWLGLTAAAILALEALGHAVPLPAMLAVAATTALAVPLLIAPFLGASTVTPNAGRLLPAFVTAEAQTNPDLGTIELVAQSDGSLRAALHRGSGTTLDEQSTTVSTSTTVTEEQQTVAALAGNLAAYSGYDVASAMQQQQVGFVVLADAEAGAATTVRTRAADALDSNPALIAIGETASGYLWRFDGLEVDESLISEANGGVVRTVDLAALALVFGIALLLAIPTGSRRRPVADRARDENPADTFEEDDNA